MPELKPAQLSKEWAGRALRPVYYLSGEEPHGKAEALKALLKAHDPGPFNLHELRGESLDVEELLSACMTQPMLGAVRLVIVKRADKLNAEARKRLAAYLKDPTPTTCLVLVADEKRPERGEALSTLAASKGAVAIFWPLKEAEALEWARAEARRLGLKLSDEGSKTLVEEIGPDMPALDQEIGKLALLAKGRPGELGREDVLDSIGAPREESVFALGNALQRRDAASALRVARELLESGEEPLSLLAQASWTLSRQLKARRLAEAGVTGEEAFRALKVSSWHNREFLALAARRSERSLVAGLQACVEVEARLKSGTPSPALELRALLLELCGDGKKAPPMVEGA